MKAESSQQSTWKLVLIYSQKSLNGTYWEKYLYSISEFSKLKHFTVSSALGVKAKFLVCSLLVLCSLFSNVILLLQIFLELSNEMDWAKVPDSDNFSA